MMHRHGQSSVIRCSPCTVSAVKTLVQQTGVESAFAGEQAGSLSLLPTVGGDSISLRNCEGNEKPGVRRGWTKKEAGTREENAAARTLSLCVGCLLLYCLFGFMDFLPLLVGGWFPLCVFVLD